LFVFLFVSFFLCFFVSLFVCFFLFFFLSSCFVLVFFLCFWKSENLNFIALDSAYAAIHRENRYRMPGEERNTTSCARKYRWCYIESCARNRTCFWILEVIDPHRVQPLECCLSVVCTTNQTLSETGWLIPSAVNCDNRARTSLAIRPIPMGNGERLWPCFRF
jgi:hypothetical protein